MWSPSLLSLAKEMPVQPTNNTLQPAFELLSSIVNEFHVRGRPCLGATLKPKLCERGFDERAFDFKNFGGFLRAAESAGYVKLSKTSGGDIAVSPTSSSIGPAQSAQPSLPFMPTATTVSPVALSSNVPLRVRPDFWNAFNSHSDKWVYDPDQDRAFRADSEGWGTPTRSLIPIPSGPKHIERWMRAFTEQQEPGIKMMLTASLDRGIDSYQFTTLTKNNGLRSWRRFHIQQVLAAIETWAREYGLHPKDVAMPFRTPSASRTLGETSLPPVTPPPAASSHLKTKLELLVDSLINDLISLRGLLAIAGPKQH
jgi:hypothetical protein